MRRGWMIVLLAALFALNLNVDVRYALRAEGFDPSARNSETYVQLPDGRTVVLAPGEKFAAKSTSEPAMLVRRNESDWSRTPLEPEREILISLRSESAIKPEFMACLLAAIQERRKVLLNYPPASSVWHLPSGISTLTALLRQDGHEVVERYGHIIGLEYLLKKHGGTDIEDALATIRNPQSGVPALYDARKIFERVSRGIATKDKFVVERNNVTYVSKHYDGSIQGMMDAINHRESHLWYDYFRQVEIPLALDFRPDVYGISIADERQFIQGCVLASMIKDTMPGTLVVLGGNFWTRVMPINDHEFARLFRFCDAIVYREGFQPIRDIVRTLKPRMASGTVWMDYSRGMTVNPPAEEAVAFETLPTPVFDGGAKQWAPDFVPSLYTMSNCPMKCGFCAISAGSDSFLGSPRAMSPKRVAQHMQELGANRFDVFDETFPIQRQIAIGKELKQLGYAATWQCYLTITDNLLDPTKCAELYEAGCRAVQLGLETLSPETLHRENKKWNSPENYGKILQNLKQAGIQTHVFLIVGFPGESLKDGFRWIPFLKEHGDSILTIKAGRYRLCRKSPEEQFGTHSRFIEVMPDDKPLCLNRNFRYLDPAMSRKRVEAVRDVLEQACRDHWAYSVTSTLPWWENRGRYSWEDLKVMANELGPKEPPVPHLERSLRKVEGVGRKI